MTKNLPPPHGSTLKTSIDTSKLSYANSLDKQMSISHFSACHVECIATGIFSPLEGFMNKSQALEVIDNMRFKDSLWTIPILLPNTGDVSVGEEVALLHDKKTLAFMQVTQIFSLDMQHYCKQVFQTNDLDHPGVKQVMDSGSEFIAGSVTLVARPKRLDIASGYYLDPVDTRKLFSDRGLSSVVAFQTRNPIHRAHEYIMKCALEITDGLLIHPLIGYTKADDIPAKVRMDCYEAIIQHYYNSDRTIVSVLPAAMHYAGPREAIHHAIMRQNFGCTHFIVGRDHAGVGDYYGTYEAQNLAIELQDLLEIQILAFEHAFYSPQVGGIATQKTMPVGAEKMHLSGTKVRQLLRDGKDLPEEFTRPEVAAVLKNWIQNSN